MISLKRSFRWARKRIDELQAKAPPDEAFVLTMFFVEKIIRRTLLQLMLRSGLTMPDAVIAMKSLKGIWAVKKRWRQYDPTHRDLESVIGQSNWVIVASSAEKRNDLVHGSGNEGQRFYKKGLTALISVLDSVRRIFSYEYAYFGWKGMKDNAGNPV